MNSRTIRQFSVPTNIWPAVERWAVSEGFNLIEDLGEKRRYQKGNGWIVLPTKLEITQNEAGVHLEVWVYGSLFNRIFTLFLLPEEITIESGGVRALIPRSIARDSVNRLLVQLAQPLIT
ncbi:MAG: hypothetical protein KA956_03745 [Pyrinomonadaceae bacterium]|nr:hypothetical protein [Acidobacteriota bacterium]MBK7934570.1 hypothetical protein [Acidobacteriota bacterium]MBP7375576.1 hypothetical protein [Pyrinomonadaceae bacterium]